jgi:hypothetical protein
VLVFLKEREAKEVKSKYTILRSPCSTRKEKTKCAPLDNLLVIMMGH